MIFLKPTTGCRMNICANDVAIWTISFAVCCTICRQRLCPSTSFPMTQFLSARSFRRPHYSNCVRIALSVLPPRREVRFPTPRSWPDRWKSLRSWAPEICLVSHPVTCSSWMAKGYRHLVADEGYAQGVPNLETGRATHTNPHPCPASPVPTEDRVQDFSGRKYQFQRRSEAVVANGCESIGLYRTEFDFFREGMNTTRSRSSRTIRWF